MSILASAQVNVDVTLVSLHHQDKVFWPDLGLTKADMVHYYIAVSPYLLPHLRKRPFIMKPFPDGVTGASYFRWQVPESAPAWLHRWRYETPQRSIDMLIIDALPDLVWAADEACIELHTWLARADRPTLPDLAVFDLDPGPEVGFPACLEVARHLHRALEQTGVRAYAKTTGRHGLHVLVPLERRYTFPQVRAWVEGVARQVSAERPELITLDKSLAARDGRVLIDYSQNGHAKSIVAPYSLRAVPEATVSTPLTWEEVSAGRVRPTDWTMLTVLPRLQKVGDLLAPLLEPQMLPGELVGTHGSS